ncbi:MAG: prepilin peptidase [Sulfurospirillum sp.]|nr:prepilin peptidase [Sulfurospirillum sp.]
MSEIIFIALIGLCVGSFLNVVILRIPKGENIAFPASHCPTCKHSLRWYHNIPLLSWVFLRGKCAFCHTSISIQYPLIEFGSTLLFILAFLQSDTLLQAAISATLFSLLLALSIIDLRYKAVPDSLSIPAFFIALFMDDFLISLQAALLLAGAFAMLRIIISWVIKKEAMGEADIIIAGVIGGALGVQLGLCAIYIAALIALPIFVYVAKKGYELPFIPFLSLGLLISWLAKIRILEFIGTWYA